MKGEGRVSASKSLQEVNEAQRSVTNGGGELEKEGKRGEGDKGEEMRKE